MSVCSASCRPCTGSRFEHCKCSGTVHFPLWSAEALPHLDTLTQERSVDSGGVVSQSAPDPDGSESIGVHAGRCLDIDLPMFGSVLLGSQFDKVVHIVVGPDSIPVVNLRARLCVHEEAVLIRFENLILSGPTQADVAVAAEVSARLCGRWFLTGTQAADWLGPTADASYAARVAPPALPGCSGDLIPTIDAEDLHALSLQWSCHLTFGGHSLGDAHRVSDGSYVLAKPTLKAKNSTMQRFATEEEVPKGWTIMSIGNQIRRCLTSEEMGSRGWRTVNGVVRGPQMDKGWWEKDDSVEFYEAQLGDGPEAEDVVEDTAVVIDLAEDPETTKPIPPVGGMDLDDLLADWDRAAALL